MVGTSPDAFGASIALTGNKFMTEQTFDVGDTVRLKSGGPVMTITDLPGNDMCRCNWFDGTSKKVSAFPLAVLEPASPPISGLVVGRSVRS